MRCEEWRAGRRQHGRPFCNPEANATPSLSRTNYSWTGQWKQTHTMPRCYCIDLWEPGQSPILELRCGGYFHGQGPARTPLVAVWSSRIARGGVPKRIIQDKDHTTARTMLPIAGNRPMAMRGAVGVHNLLIASIKYSRHLILPPSRACRGQGQGSAPCSACESNGDTRYACGPPLAGRRLLGFACSRQIKLRRSTTQVCGAQVLGRHNRILASSG